MAAWKCRTALVVIGLVSAASAGCAVEPTVSGAAGATQVTATPRPLGPGEVRAPGPEQAPSKPGQQVVLLHCGVQDVMYEGVRWEVEDPPFDSGSAPEQTFSGFGTWEREAAFLTFTDAKGAVLRFTRWNGEDDAEAGA